MNNFELGQKIIWSIGREQNPIILRGLFLETLSETRSKVLLYEQNGLRRKTEIEVETILLEEDNGRN